MSNFKQRASGLWVPEQPEVARICSFFDMLPVEQQRQKKTTAGGGGDAFDHSEYFAGYPLFLDPLEANVTKDGSNRVSNILATGTVGENWAQGTAGLQPLWVADAGGGKPGITFQFVSPNTGELARTNSALNAYLSSADTNFAIMIISFSDVVETKRPLRLANGRLDFLKTADSLGYMAGGGFVRPAVTVAGATRYIVAGRRAAGKTGISLDGGAWTELTDSNPNITTSGSNRFGSNEGGDESFTVQMVALTTAYPGDEKYATIIAGLQAEFGLS